MTFDDDSTFDEPARKRTPRKATSSAGAKAKKRKSKRTRVDMARVARFAGIGMTAVIGTGIIVNALMMQKGRHPAPLFGRQVVLAAAEPVRPAVPSHVVPAPRAKAPVADDDASAVPTPAVRPQHDASAAPDTGDPIGRLLRTGSAPAASEENPADPKTVLGAQHALMKLGFVVKPNGTLGPATRKAIQAFEKERHLPMKGELSHRIVKILSAESGIRID